MGAPPTAKHSNSRALDDRTILILASILAAKRVVSFNCSLFLLRQSSDRIANSLGLWSALLIIPQALQRESSQFLTAFSDLRASLRVSNSCFA
jgi:hypothetical protein